jgi:hypothetical protein
MSLINPPFFFVFDVESVGLHGEGFQVGVVVVGREGKFQEERLFSCPLSNAFGDEDGIAWCIENVPDFEKGNLQTPREVRKCFYDFWMTWKGAGAVMAADCAWPVEARFLCAMIDDNRQGRAWDGPYPLIDIGSVIFAEPGGDPLSEFTRLENELPKHNPLCDARQSARILISNRR